MHNFPCPTGSFECTIHVHPLQELELERRWAASRPSVRARTQDAADRFHDPPGSFLAALSVSERQRYEKYSVIYGPVNASLGRTYDLGQDPVHRPLVSRLSGSLGTLIANMGLMVTHRANADRSQE
eukprot:15479084-Alexandrium_andersonii.AAC.1